MALLIATTFTMGAWAQTDVTSQYLTNAGFESIDGWTVTVDHIGETYGGTYYKLDTGTDPNTIEVYHTWAGTSAPLDQTKNFKLSQKVTLPAGEYRLKVNGFYREGNQQNATTEKAWAFAGENKQNLVGIGTCGANSMADAATVFKNGGCLNEFDFTITEAGEIEIGFEGYINTSLSWVILGPVSLWQYSMDDFNAELTAARTKLQGVTGLNAAMVAKVTEMLAETETVTQTKAAILDATAKVNALYDEAMAMQTAIAGANDAIAGCESMLANSTADDKTTFEAAIATAKSDLDAAANTAAINTLLTTLNEAKMAYSLVANPAEGHPFDMTHLITNPGFDNGTNGWSCESDAQNKGIASNKSNGIITGSFYENWKGSNFTGTIYQTIKNIPLGVYKLKAAAFGNGAHVFANEEQTQVTTSDGDWYEVEVKVTNGTLNFGIKNNNNTNWMGIDNASLMFISRLDLSEVVIAYEAALARAQEAAAKTDKMDIAVMKALDDAISAYGSVDETNQLALEEAIVALETATNNTNASITFFATNKLAIDAMFALMESTNVYTAEAYETYSAKAEDFLAQYEAGTLTATVDNPATVHGWRADVDYDVMLLSAFGAPEDDWDNLHINTWSTEGEGDGSEFKVPFYELWTGNGESLAVATKTATVTGLTPDQYYSVEVWARVRAKDGVVAADATGITLSVGDGEAVDLTEGEVVGTSQFSHAVFTAYGYADAEGKLTINFNVLEGNNISWLSFKNLKYTEVPVVEPEYLTVVGAKVGDVAIVEGAATVESISTIDVIFDRPVALAENAGWATVTDEWGENPLKAEVLAENNCAVRFSLQWDLVIAEEGNFPFYVPEGLIIGAEDANYINTEITATITVEAAPVTPTPTPTPLGFTNVTVGEVVVTKDLTVTVVATPDDVIKVNFDGELNFQGTPVIEDAEGNDASDSFMYANGLDVGESKSSYILQGMNAGIYTITLPKASFWEMAEYKAPAEDIVLTVEIVAASTGIQNISVGTDAVIYDLSGRRVEKAVKGIYIVNGKKVIK